MKANETNLLKFLQGSKQFIIPIYQRKYSWTTKQCRQIWQDVLRVAKDEHIKAHFIGSIVYIERGIYNISAVPQLLVIDGQQRLTTLSLLLLALRDEMEERQATVGIGINGKKLRNYYLVNNDEDGELYHRLILTKSDKETFMALIEDREPYDISINILQNYNYFKEEIRKMKISLDDLYHGLSKLIMVDIALDRENDNPQLIFESLNSTGLDLNQADLIRNYLLMGLELKVQEDLYERYWRPIEIGFGNLADATVFDRFARDYLTVKTGRIPNIRNIYQDFKGYTMGEASDDIEKILHDMHRYAKYYTYLLFQKEPDIEIRHHLKEISTLKVDVSYPFLLQAYRTYEEGGISKDEFIEILKLVESYVFRRAICGVPTNSLNHTFLSLMKEIDVNNYIKSMEVALLTKTSNRRFPDNAEFSRELKVKDIYHFRNRNYLLRKLENAGRKESVNTEEYTIEHIMPQNEKLSQMWKDELGPDWKHVHENYLHTLGNLTLTGYNSELSDRSFGNKLVIEGGFKDSPLRLNRSVARQTVWNKQSIKERADELIEKAKTIWRYPDISDEEKQKYGQKQNQGSKTTYTMDSYEHLNGKMLILFENLRHLILNMDSSVREEFTKLYIAYKTVSNFVDIVPQKSKLRLSLNMPFSEIIDPHNKCLDVTRIGRWGNGDVEIHLQSEEEIPHVIELIQQSFDYQMEK